MQRKHLKFLAGLTAGLGLAALVVPALQAAAPLVSIHATGDAFENTGENGAFMVSREGDTSQALAVTYKILGTAQNGVDYVRLSGSIRIPAGQASAPVIVRAINNSKEETNRVVRLELLTAASPFTFAVLPDTQIYVRYPFLDFFDSQTRWIVDNKDSRNIVHVFQEGDCTDFNTDPEWLKFKNVMSRLDGVVPYSLVPGNHDGLDASPWDTSRFNQYYPVAAFTNQETFGGVFEAGKLDNSFQLTRAGGVDWLILGLEFGPRDEVLAWANLVVTNHPGHKAILLTHAHVYSDDTLFDTSRAQSWNPIHYGRPNDGVRVWNKLIRHHANFALVFSGHVLNDGAGRVVMTGNHGNQVYQMLANYQYYPNGGNSLMRLVEFVPAEDKFTVKTYAPYSDTYFVHPKHQFDYSNLGWFSASNDTYEIDAGQASATITIHDDDLDSVPPWITSVTALGVPPEIRVVFSEPIRRADAEDVLNFSLDHGESVRSASLDATARVLTLGSSQLATGLLYTLTVNDVFDRARRPNIIVPNTMQSFSYQPLLLDEKFEASELVNWTVLDQGTRDGPSTWYTRAGRAEQSANIYGPDSISTDHRLGTILWWNKSSAFARSNYSVAVTMINSDDDGVGLVFRYTNPSNYYKLELDLQRNFRKLLRLADGIETTLASEAQSYQQNVPTRLQIRADESTITASVDGTNLFGGPVTDLAPIPAGTVGLYCWGSTGVAFYDLMVAAEDLPPVSNEGFDETNNFNAFSTVTLQAIDGLWRFWPFEFEPDSGWQYPSYDDSTWPGPNLAIFAREPDSIPDPRNTDLDLGPITYYFRTSFEFNRITNEVQLRFRTLIDDGAIIYFNGAEIARLGMPDGPVSNATLAGREVDNADYEGPFDFPATNFVTGVNVIAVELHQSSPFSEDVVFGLELEAMVPVPVPVRIQTPRLLPDGRFRLSFPSQANRIYAIESSTNLIHWAPFLTRTNVTGQPIVIDFPFQGERGRFFRVITVP